MARRAGAAKVFRLVRSKRMLKREVSVHSKWGLATSPFTAHQCVGDPPN